MAEDYRHYRAMAGQLAKYVDPETREAILAGMDYVHGSHGRRRVPFRDHVPLRGSRWYSAI
jgi:hypothetical protein